MAALRHRSRATVEAEGRDRMKRRLIIAGVIAALFIAAIWLVFAWQAHRSRFDYSGTVETREIQIGSKIGGRVTRFRLKRARSSRLGRHSSASNAMNCKAQRAQAQASLEQAQADLDKMLRGNRPEEIAQAEATANAQQAALAAARNGPRRRRSEQAQADYCRRQCRRN